jgi:hypothetical protein
MSRKGRRARVDRVAGLARKAVVTLSYRPLFGIGPVTWSYSVTCPWHLMTPERRQAAAASREWFYAQPPKREPSSLPGS